MSVLSGSRAPVGACAGLALAGAALVLAWRLELAPSWLAGVGAVATSTAIAWGLAVRTGGRPVVSAVVALVLGGLALVVGVPPVRAGAAVLTCAGGAVLAVLATVPARTTLAAVREVLVAGLVAGVTAVAILGYRPWVSPGRFEYVALGLSLATVLLVVHGLTTRGVAADQARLEGRELAAVAGAGVLLFAVLAYAETLRRFGSPALVTPLDGAGGWARETLGAVPRPLPTLLGVPALVWGCHLRARRTRGWWVCAFGVAATAPIAAGLLRPSAVVVDSVLGLGYGLLLGVAGGLLLVGAERALARRRGRDHGDGPPALPREPRRTEPLL